MDNDDFLPPPPRGPPPLLDEAQLLHLAQQGWLFLELPATLSQSMSGLFRASSRYFDLPESEKKDLYPSKQGTEFGYYPVVDEKEYVTFRCRIHTARASDAIPPSPLVESLEASTAVAWHDAGLLLFRILCDIVRASDLDTSVLHDILDGTLDLPESEDRMTYTLMRLFRYFPSTGKAEEHTDLGLLTLCVGDGAGLQVLDRFNSSPGQFTWVDAPVGTQWGAILVGQTLKALSAQSMNAGAHRVVGNPQGRHSVVYALRHSMMHDVDFSLFGGEGKMTPKELWRTIQTGKVNINAKKEFREMQRAKLQTSKSGIEGSESSESDDVKARQAD
ncbi:hypothetical protein ABEF95_010031 [Exophiala dermatitidis]